jgi:hypothetical protein
MLFHDPYAQTSTRVAYADGVRARTVPAGGPAWRARILDRDHCFRLPNKCDVRVDMTGDREMLFVTHLLTLHVPYDKVSTLEYGQHVAGRYPRLLCFRLCSCSASRASTS